MASNYEHHETPAELRNIEAALNGLAQLDRAAASPALERRLESILHQVRNPPAPIPITRRTHVLARMRIAAAVLLTGALGVLIAGRLATQSAPPAGPGAGPLAAAETLDLEEDVELWLALRTPDEFQGVADRLDLINAEAQAIDSSVSGDWGAMFDTSM
jgi:hypothetical protein